MSLDPRTPVIVGVAQQTWREGDAPDPIEMCAEVVSGAAHDAGGGPELLRGAQALGVVDIASRRWSDPAALVAARLGITPAQTLRTQLGGDGPQLLVSELATQIASGALEAGVVCGAEALSTLARAMKDGREPDWPALDEGAQPSATLGEDRFPASEQETAADLIAPVLMYPLFENALWAQAGGTLEEHRLRLGELWAGLSSVAARNEHAWSRTARSAEQIATPGEGNRVVSLPYTKLLNSHIQTDQAAALILCSAGRAEALGIARDRWVFPHAAGHAYDHWFVSERENLRSSPAIRLAAAAALEHAGLTIGAVDRLDIYSCFPSAVQIACAEIGIDAWMDERPLTVTGGLTFAGGPGNNYVTHSIAQMAERLRESEGATGLVTAVGWYMTKHAVAVYGSAPPARGFAALRPQEQVDALPARSVAAGYTGAATGEAATVLYDIFGAATLGAVTALLDDGRRALAKTTDAGTLAALAEGPAQGRALRFDGAGGFVLA
jgi:acetyl-CoA C-acetyltransferase